MPLLRLQRRNRSVSGTAILAAALLGTGRVASGQHWSATSLHPAGFTHTSLNAITPTQQFGVAGNGAIGQQPAIWSGSPGSLLLLGTSPQMGGGISGAAGTQQVGSFGGHASVWHGTPGSRVDLHQAGWFGSSARATTGDEQVGAFGLVQFGLPHAVLWHGTAQSAVELHPAGVGSSAAVAVAGGQQGGYTGPPGGGLAPYRAALWSGTAASYVSLHPGPNFQESQVLGMVPGQQVGWASQPGIPSHAAMWSGTAASYMDINPPSAGLSHLNATVGTAQVGYANLFGFGISAGIWFGTAESFIPLAPYLPPGIYGESVATSVAFENGVYYVGGYASNNLTGAQEAMLWVGVPTPGVLPLLAAAGFWAARRRR